MFSKKIKILDRFIYMFCGELNSIYFESEDKTKYYDDEEKELFEIDWVSNTLWVSRDLLYFLIDLNVFEELEYRQPTHELFKEYSHYAFGFNPKWISFF